MPNSVWLEGLDTKGRKLGRDLVPPTWNVRFQNVENNTAFWSDKTLHRTVHKPTKRRRRLSFDSPYKREYFKHTSNTEYFSTSRITVLYEFI